MLQCPLMLPRRRQIDTTHWRYGTGYISLGNFCRAEQPLLLELIWLLLVRNCVKGASFFLLLLLTYYTKKKTYQSNPSMISTVSSLTGRTVSVVVWFAMNASLGAMNPAVTLSLFMRGDLDGYTASSYVVAQFIAGFAAYIWWKHTSPAPIVKPDVGIWSVFDKRPFNGGGAPTQPVRTN